MKIEITNIPDVTESNLDESKIDFADKILTGLYPIFEKVKIKKGEKLEESKKRVLSLKNSLKEEKQNIENLAKVLELKEKQKKFIESLQKLVSLNLVHDGNIRNEMLSMIKKVDRLPKDKLDSYTNKVTKLISKRYN